MTAERKEAALLALLDAVERQLAAQQALQVALQEGWMDLASARYAMGPNRVGHLQWEGRLMEASTLVQVSGYDRPLRCLPSADMESSHQASDTGNVTSKSTIQSETNPSVLSSERGNSLLLTANKERSADGGIGERGLRKEGRQNEEGENGAEGMCILSSDSGSDVKGRFQRSSDATTSPLYDAKVQADHLSSSTSRALEKWESVSPFPLESDTNGHAGRTVPSSATSLSPSSLPRFHLAHSNSSSSSSHFKAPFPSSSIETTPPSSKDSNKPPLPEIGSLSLSGSDASAVTPVKSRNEDDPIKWFGGLVPMSLRHAQKVFRNAVVLALEASNAQQSLDEAQAHYASFNWEQDLGE
eukprot:TRINITY_DN1301_c0_g2_i1.p1 TRINITY_DN1301_c0_g2~~TRINITY_DN1301_c0_g2_i1.p1  ORF type:complete len:356 (-),score=58.75 TRINITY_DN1301_c0_g2_i1:64-1131(-)